MFEKLVDTKKLVFRLWLSLWIILGILVIFKLCFNIWYPIVVENETLIKISNYIDNNKYLKYIIMAMFYITSLNVWFLTSTLEKTYKNIKFSIISQILIIACYIIKVYNNVVGCIIEIVYLILIPICINFKNKNINKIRSFIIPIIVYALVSLWQMNILFIRDISNILSDLPMFIWLFIQLDYYLFLIIMWLGVSYMGLLSGGWFFGKDITKLKAMKEKELAKKEPDKKLIERIDKAIEKQEKKKK